MKTFGLKIFVFPLILVGLIDRIHAIDEPELTQICSKKSQIISFSSVKKVQSAIEAYEKNPNECPSEFGDSFRELKLVLSKEVLKDVCAPNAYTAIRSFHTQFISYYTPEATKDELKEAKRGKTLKPIPESLRRFFILFVLQISAQCKRELVSRLDELVKGKIRREDFDIMAEMKTNGSRLFGDIYKESVNSMKQVYILPPHLKAASIADKESKLYVQVHFGDVFKKIKDVCKAKFRPVYNELFTPIILLNNLGYYDRANTEPENEQLGWKKEVTRWYSIIETCEVFEDIEVIQDSSSMAAFADFMMQYNSPLGQAQPVTILLADEAEKLKAEIDERIMKESKLVVYEPKPIQVDHKVITFAPRMWITEDSIRSDEIRQFERETSSLISAKTNFMRLFAKDTSHYLKSRLHKYRTVFRSQDESHALGRLAAFLIRHKVALQTMAAIVGLIIVGAHFAG